MRTVLSCILTVLVAMTWSTAAVQDEPEPDPGATAATILLDASTFGNGWVLTEVISPDSIERYGFTMSPDVFSEGAAGIYVGPEGARVLIVNLLLTDSRVAIRRSWEDSIELMDAITWTLDTDYTRDQQLETMAPPEGCLESKRAEGKERTFRIPAGATLCAADDESVLLVLAFGTVNGQTGVAASDSVISQIVAT